jgi:hypothetical protein
MVAHGHGEERGVLEQHLRQLVLPLGDVLRAVVGAGRLGLREQQLRGEVRHHPADPRDHLVAEQRVIVVREQVAQDRPRRRERSRRRARVRRAALVQPNPRFARSSKASFTASP